MVHPGDLLRTTSDAERFTAPLGNLHLEPPDCGLNLLPWVTAKFKLDKHNRNSVFVGLLSILTILHATSTSYFIGTAKVWRLNYDIREVVAEWMVYLGPICGGLFSLVLSHYGEITHRPCYIGGLAMLHAVGGWMLMLPELYHPSYDRLNAADVINQTLCRTSVDSYMKEEFDEGKKIISLTILAVYQLVHGLAFVSMVSHGVAHIDDGTNKYATPTFICWLIATSQIGRFIGLNLTLVPVAFNRHIFFSIAWLITMTGIFIFGFLLSLFSRLPQRILLRHGVNTLLNRQSRQGRPFPVEVRPEETPKYLGFFQTLKSMFRSNILVLNTMAATFMHVAIINFNAMREEFYRARQVNFADDFDYHFSFYNVSALLFMCVTVLVMAQIFSRMRPGAKFLVIWNIAVYVAIAGFFSSYAFLKCEDKISLLSYNQVIGECNAYCHCTVDVFEPVCLGGKTYYSPCFAGCTKRDEKEFTGCTCDTSSLSTTATAGSCNQAKCKVVAFFAEANSVITFGLQISAFIVHMIISLRAVEHHQSRASGIGLLLFGVQLLPYLPFKIIYEVIKSTHCLKSHGADCFLFTEHFALVISLVTFAFMLLSIVMAVFMLQGAGQVNLYKKRNSPQPGNEIGMDTLQETHEDCEQESTPSVERARNINYAATLVNNKQNGRSKYSAENSSCSEIDAESDDENVSLRKNQMHEKYLRESLNRVYNNATSPSTGSLQSDGYPPGPKVGIPQRMDRSVIHEFESRDIICNLDGRIPSPGEDPEKKNTSDKYRFKSQREEFGDSDIDRELERIERENIPVTITRKISFSETNF